MEERSDELDVYFVYDIINDVFNAYFLIPKKRKLLELPYISKKNRKFNVNEKIIIPEKFLKNGENVIYIFHQIISEIKNNITAELIIDGFLCFEMDEPS